MRGRRTVIACSLAALTSGMLILAASGPILKYRIRQAAARRHLEVDVAAVRIAWAAVDLYGVTASLPGGMIGVRAKSVRVDLSVFLSPTRVAAHGVTVRVIGTSSELEDSLQMWRAKQGAEPGVSIGRPLPVAADGISLEWREREVDEPVVEIRGSSVERTGDGFLVSFENARLHAAPWAVDVSDARTHIAPSGALVDAHASQVTLETSEDNNAAVAPVKTGSEPTPPPLPLPTSGASPVDDAATAPNLRLKLPELAALRARLVALGNVGRRALAEHAQIAVDSLALAITEGKTRLAIGRGPLTALRDRESIGVTFTTQTNSVGTPVSLNATLPLTAGDAVVSFAGGPISLALLGVDEGAAGLVEVGQTTVSGHGRASLDAPAESLTVDGELVVHAMSINRPSIASEIVRGIDATVLARGTLDAHGALRIDDAEVGLGALRLGARGTIAQTADHFSASLGFEIAPAQCQALLQSIPSALVPILDGAEFAGALGAKGRLSFDSTALDDLSLDWRVDDGCSMSVVPETLAKERFMRPFEHTIYLPDGTLAEETTGPTTDDWTELEHVSPFVQVALLTTEDGAFYKHHGFSRGAMRNALVADLKAGRFVRGASTITMQLAKNLFLFREKTLSRKLEEIVLADYLEESFTKKEMMELYLNVIEFGPNVYGITQAAFHYFGRKPDELNLAESLFLASLLPSPLRFHKLAEKPQLSEGWARHLHQLMQIAAKNDLISGEELADGLKEEVIFHDLKAPLPPPRPAVTGTHFEPPPPEGAANWQETKGP